MRSRNWSAASRMVERNRFGFVEDNVPLARSPNWSLSFPLADMPEELMTDVLTVVKVS